MRCYTCRHCGASFSQLGNLANHEGICAERPLGKVPKRDDSAEALRGRSQEIDNLLERHQAELDCLIYGDGFYTEDEQGNRKRVHPLRVTIEDCSGCLIYYVDGVVVGHLHHLKNPPEER